MTDLTKRESAVFAVEGLEPRLALMKELVWPKLDAAGAALAPRLSSLVGHALTPHVPRPGTNDTAPPIEAFCAFARDAKDPRAVGHFVLSITVQAVEVRLVLEAEAEASRAKAATQLTAKAKELAKRYSRDAWLRSFRNWDKGELPPLVNPRAKFFEEEARRLSQPGGRLDLGYGFPVGDGVPSDDELCASFEKLLPLYEVVAGGS